MNVCVCACVRACVCVLFVHVVPLIRSDTIRFEMLFNVSSKADMSQLNLSHEINN